MNRYGIVLLGIPYNNEWLVEQWMERGQKPFEYIWDSGHLNCILVKGGDGGWVEIENKIELPENLTETEWTQARKEDLAQNRKESEEEYIAIRDFILRNRESGKAATLRAALDSSVASPAAIDKQRGQLFRNFVARPPSGTAIPADMLMVPPADLLRSGTIPIPFTEEPAPAPPPTSNFGRTNWDDDND